MPWTTALSVGVKQIDDQHKTLFEKAEKLFEAGKNNQAKEYVGELLAFLEDYTKKHFADEERYMLSIGYPGLDEQKRAHIGFVMQLTKIRSDYAASGGNIMVITSANQLMLQWLTRHISDMDKKIGQYAKSIGRG